MTQERLWVCNVGGAHDHPAPALFSNESGQYGAKVDVDEDADIQTRLIAFVGRRP
jgi:hypothetical protein